MLKAVHKMKIIDLALHMNMQGNNNESCILS
jgi:hypothetical protein